MLNWQRLFQLGEYEVRWDLRLSLVMFDNGAFKSFTFHPALDPLITRVYHFNMFPLCVRTLRRQLSESGAPALPQMYFLSSACRLLRKKYKRRVRQFGRLLFGAREARAT